MDESEHDGNDEQLWTIGAVTQRTGVGEHTLRAWERRFGFPRPVRLPSGHRRYTGAQVRRLTRIQQALAVGHRAGDVVPLSDSAIDALLSAPVRSESSPSPFESADEFIAFVVTSLRRLDGDSVRGLLERESMRLGLHDWMRNRIGPLLTAVGEMWRRGELEVHHEHFLSEIIEDLLRAKRRAVEGGSGGRPVILATLPRELHAIGLHLAALTIANAGIRVRLLGPDTPVDHLVAAATEAAAGGVGVSVSSSSDADATRKMLSALRQRLPARIELWVGGAGARAAAADLPGVRVAQDLESLEALAVRACL